MKKISVIIIFIIFANHIFGGVKKNKASDLKQTLTEYFKNMKKQYNYTKTWKSKLLIYRSFFPEFANLLKDNAKNINHIGAYYFVGLSSGYLDIVAHISYLEDNLYQGEWLKASGVLLKKYYPKVYNQIYNDIDHQKMKYYKLYVGKRQVFIEKLITHITHIFTKNINYYVKKFNEAKVFMAGYINPHLTFISLNYYLDNKIKIEPFIDVLMKTIKPKKKDESLQR